MAAVEKPGMRKGELLSLQWKQVRFLQNDLYRSGAKAKARRHRKIPISTDAARDAQNQQLSS